jgi:hypothetical protein
MGILDRPFQTRELSLRGAPLRHLFVEQHPRKDEEERQTETGERDVGRTGAVFFNSMARPTPSSAHETACR